MAERFYICKTCGNIVGLIKDGGGSLACCGEAMVELVPNTVDAAQEKHVPFVTVNRENGEVEVQIGSVPHPMTEAHWIEWVHLQTREGGQMKRLKAGKAPEAVFQLTADDEPVAVFAYCNLHGLWKTEL